MLQIFNALSDPARLAVVELLSKHELSISELAAPFEMALPSFMQHLKVLEYAGLIDSTKVGRVRTCRLRPEALRTAQTWLHQQQKIWESRLEQLDSYLLTMEAAEE